MRAEEAFAQRIERARADVAINDADCGNCDGEKLAGGRIGTRQKSSNPATRLGDALGEQTLNQSRLTAHLNPRTSKS
jgi:hypothetical protein